MKEPLHKVEIKNKIDQKFLKDFIYEISSSKIFILIMQRSFDSFSKNYNEVVNDSIRQTGYDTESLVSAKLHKIAKFFPELTDKKFRLLDFGCGVGNLYGGIG